MANASRLHPVFRALALRIRDTGANTEYTADGEAAKIVGMDALRVALESGHEDHRTSQAPYSAAAPASLVSASRAGSLSRFKSALTGDWENWLLWRGGAQSEDGIMSKQVLESGTRHGGSWCLQGCQLEA